MARIVTPGTLTDAALIDDKQDIWLLAVTTLRNTAGLARLNLASGEFILLEVPADQISSTLERIRPAEILYPESWTPNFALDVARTRQPDWYFEFDSARRLLERGVRFLQVWHKAGQPWDAHDQLEHRHG